MISIPLGLRSYERSKQNREVPVLWDERRVINGHWLVVGSSGTGKTWTLRRMINAMIAGRRDSRLRVHVFDVHGDITMDNAGAPALPSTSVVRFSESTQYGLNPLQVDPDPDYGGVRRRIQGLINALNHTSRELGTKQEAVLRAILLDLYAANGYYDGQPASWITAGQMHRGYPKKCPTLTDALRFATAKHKAIYLGTNAKAISALEAVNKRAGALFAKARALNKETDTEVAAVKDAELEKAIEASISAFELAVRAIRTGRELDDALRYDSKDVLKSIVERLENLANTGIFRPEVPPFDPKATVWGYDIRSLPEDEKKLFVRFRLEQIFQMARQRGVQSEICDVIVVDEAHLFFDEAGDNPLNAIAKEARKFGVGLVSASQSPTHFSEDFLGNCGTKVLLGLDTMYWDGACRKLKIEPDKLKWLKPSKTAAISIKVQGDITTNFMNVDVDPAAMAAAEALVTRAA